MKKQKANKLVLITLFSALAIGTYGVQNIKDAQAAPLGTELQYHLYDPTPEPSKFLNVWNTNGYALQPESVINKKVGEPYTINTDAARSVWSVMTGVLDAPHYRWYKSEDGKTWKALSEDQNGHKKNLPLDTSEEGRTWYQLDTQYWNYLTGWAAKTHIYSNISEVNVLTEDVDAESVKVTTEDSYLYNTGDKMMNVTYAHAKTNPLNATGTIEWSVDKPDIATIDKLTGKITSNSKGITGDVNIIATYKGSNSDDPKVVVGKTKISVGGGLNKPTAYVGNSATFELQGTTDDFYGWWDDNEIYVEWYKKAAGQSDRKAKLLGVTKGTTYTTDPVTSSDVNSLYRAKIIMRKNSKEMTLTTAWTEISVR